MAVPEAEAVAGRRTGNDKPGTQRRKNKKIAESELEIPRESLPVMLTDEGPGDCYRLGLKCIARSKAILNYRISEKCFFAIWINRGRGEVLSSAFR